MGLLFGLHLIEQRVQRLEPRLPVPPKLLGPERRFLQRRGFEPTKMLTPGYTTTDEPGRLQHAHVLGSRGERHLEGRGELAEIALTTRKLPNNRAPGRVRKGMKNEVEPRRAIQNHVVYYTERFHDRKRQNHRPTRSSLEVR